MKAFKNALLIAAASLAMTGIAQAESLTGNSSSTGSASSSLSDIAPQAGDASILTRHDIRTMQETLIRNGYLTGNADGVIGSRTESALRRFQQDNDLSVTGTATGETMMQLGLAGVTDGTGTTSRPYVIDRANDYTDSFDNTKAFENTNTFDQTDNPKPLMDYGPITSDDNNVPTRNNTSNPQ